MQVLLLLALLSQKTPAAEVLLGCFLHAGRHPVVTCTETLCTPGLTVDSDMLQEEKATREAKFTEDFAKMLNKMNIAQVSCSTWLSAMCADVIL